MAYTSADAKKSFLKLCREASEEDKRIYIRDGAGKLALTIDPDEHEDAIPISRQFFKDNFARCSSLVKSGMIFRVDIKGAAPVYIRRHTSYSDPLDPMVEAWFERRQKAAADKAVGEAMKKIAALKTLDRDEVIEQFDAIRKGLERIAIRHHPFREGQIPDA